VGFLQDLRYAIRTFRKDAAFTLIAVLSLALGTGANSAMFSFVNGLLLRPLPVSNSSGVMTLAPTESEKIVNFGGISYPDYLDYRDRTKTMTDLVAFDLWRFGFSLSPDVVPQAKYGLLVSGNLFQAMGVKAPAELLLALPYAVALLVLVIVGKGAAAPASLGVPFRRNH